MSRKVFRYSALFGVAFFSAFQPSPSHADAALAFGQYGNGGAAWGTAFNYRSRSEAQNYAMSSCNARGYNCAVQVTFHNACLALAVQDNGNGNGWSVRPDLAAAHRDALARCVQYGLSCSIRASFCDEVDGDAIRQAEQNQRQAEYDEYVKQWYACFTQAEDLGAPILACNQALGFPRSSYDNRRKLIERRDSLIRFREQVREQREREARQAQIRSQQAAEEAARQAEQRAAEASAAAQQTKEQAERERQSLEEQIRSRQAAEEAARQAEQRAAEASAAARQAEQRAREAERAAQLAGENKRKPVEGSLLKKPVPEVYAALVFLFCLYAALKEIIKAKVPPRYKFAAVFSIAFAEWFIFWIMGVSPTDPRLADVIAVSTPPLGIWLGFEYFPKPTAA